MLLLAAMPVVRDGDKDDDDEQTTAAIIDM